MDLPLDPSEAIGPTEYEEIFREQDDKRRMLLDMIEEDRMYHHLQYPYRHSN